ncbi:MAG: BatD family protein [Verrucomicrobiota bacterium]|nr:BatD family protein [Verrucomicrobiota bacterium]
MASAAEPSVTAVLSSSQTALGQPVQLEIQVTGTANPKPPTDIVVDGLDIRSAGVSRQYQMQNFSVSYSFTYNYTIMPLKAGTFKIPPQTVDAGGRSLRTPELTLTVVASAARPGRSGRDPNVAAAEPGKGNFLELLVPKTTAYVGEMIPTQLRLGVNPRTPLESLGNNGVQIPGQGLTMQKIPEPRPTMEVVGGQSYQLVIFKTAIASARSGKLEIGPAELNPVVRVPRNQQRNPSLPRDLFDDPFFNNFFNDPAFAPSVAKEIKLKSQPVTLDVKPLPPNAPPTFSGAVGTFTMKVDAAPKKAKAGDPITVTATISGRGNFDRVTAPTLQDENGWHAYPPNDKFKQDDDVGISGDKTFEIVLSANERKNKLSPFVFIFFDPVKETYVTLRSDAIPLVIDGPAPKPAATVPTAASGTPSASPTPAAKPDSQDILYQLTERPAGRATFQPLYERRNFWLAQLLPLLAVAGFIAWRLRQARLADRVAQRVAKLQQEAAELQRKLRRDGQTAEQYFADASRAVQIRTALARNVDPNVVDAAAAASAFRLDEQARARLQQLFDRNDELRYSGGRNGGAEQVPAESRREILELVESMHV